MSAGEIFPPLPRCFSVKHLLSVLPLLHKPFPSLFRTLWHCNHNMEATKILSLCHENSNFLRSGVRSVWPPQHTGCSRSHLLGSWELKVRHPSLVNYNLIHEDLWAGVHSKRVSHILPASFHYLFFHRQKSIYLLLQEQTRWLGRETRLLSFQEASLVSWWSGTWGGHICSQNIFKPARLCRRRPLEPAQWKKCKPLFRENTGEFLKAESFFSFFFLNFLAFQAAF